MIFSFQLEEPKSDDLNGRVNQITFDQTDEQNRIKYLENENSALKNKVNELEQRAKTLEIQVRCYEKNEFEVEKILDDKLDKGKRLYLVRWKHFDSNSDTWEKETFFKKRPEILSAYLSSKQAK